VETDIAYRIAADIERELRDHRQTEIDAEDLVKLTFELITRCVGSEVASRYLAWRQAKRAGCPVFIVLGGAPGVGKSTLATRLAVRLGITRIVTTDTIREVLRTVIPATVHPELHVSTYETSDGEDRSLQSFRRQARAVGAATAAVASRLASERRSAIIEGVHLLPGQLRAEFDKGDGHPIVVEMLLTLADEDLHSAHLGCRLNGEPARGGERHLKHFGRIRQLQGILREIAQQSQVEEYDIADPVDFTQRIVDQVVARVPQTKGEKMGAA
jgi:2-phosphoglycerate kinase